MEDRQQQAAVQEPAVSAQEPVDIDQVASQLRELMENRLTEEAIVRFSRLRAPDQAGVLPRLPSELQALLTSRLSPEDLGSIIEEMETPAAVELSQRIEPGILPQVLDKTSPDIAADVLRALPQEAAATTLEQMREAADVIPLLGYEDDDAGGLMTPDFIALREGMTVAQALSFFKYAARDFDPEDVNYLFVVDNEGVLKGIVSLAQIVLGLPHQRISLLMNPDVISVPVDTDQEEAARLMDRYNVSHLAVVDEAGKLVGALKLESIIEVLEEEATEDMYRMIGVDEEEKVLGPFWHSVRSRLPWLCVNLATAILAGFVVSLFESTLAKAAVLASFLPVIAGQGGIAGTQTLTLMVRSIALGEVTFKNMRWLLLKETGLGVVHGAALAILVGAIAIMWKGNEWLALVVFVAMIGNLIVAGVSGVIVPLGFKAMRIDPALSSAVAVTTFTDVLGFLIYLGLASTTIGLILSG